MPSKESLMRSMVFWALFFLILGLIMGVYSREMLRPAEKTLDPVSLELVSQRMFLGHGHFIFLGSLIPLGLALVLKVFAELPGKSLGRFHRWWTASRIGIASVLALSTYKSTAMVLTWVRQPDWTIVQVDETLYLGSIMLRSLLYTASHVTMGVSIIALAVILMKNLRTEKN